MPTVPDQELSQELVILLFYSKYLKATWSELTLSNKCTQPFNEFVSNCNLNSTTSVDKFAQFIERNGIDLLHSYRATYHHTLVNKLQNDKLLCQSLAMQAQELRSKNTFLKDSFIIQYDNSFSTQNTQLFPQPLRFTPYNEFQQAPIVPADVCFSKVTTDGCDDYIKLNGKDLHNFVQGDGPAFPKSVILFDDLPDDLSQNLSNTQSSNSSSQIQTNQELETQKLQDSAIFCMYSKYLKAQWRKVLANIDASISFPEFVQANKLDNNLEITQFSKFIENDGVSVLQAEKFMDFSPIVMTLLTEKNSFDAFAKYASQLRKANFIFTDLAILDHICFEPDFSTTDSEPVDTNSIEMCLPKARPVEFIIANDVKPLLGNPFSSQENNLSQFMESSTSDVIIPIKSSKELLQNPLSIPRTNQAIITPATVFDSESHAISVLYSNYILKSYMDSHQDMLSKDLFQNFVDNAKYGDDEQAKFIEYMETCVPDLCDRGIVPRLFAIKAERMFSCGNLYFNAIKQNFPALTSSNLKNCKQENPRCSMKDYQIDTLFEDNFGRQAESVLPLSHSIVPELKPVTNYTFRESDGIPLVIRSDSTSHSDSPSDWDSVIAMNHLVNNVHYKNYTSKIPKELPVAPKTNAKLQANNFRHENFDLNIPNFIPAAEHFENLIYARQGESYSSTHLPAGQQNLNPVKRRNKVL